MQHMQGNLKIKNQAIQINTIFLLPILKNKIRPNRKPFNSSFLVFVDKKALNTRQLSIEIFQCTLLAEVQNENYIKRQQILDLKVVILLKNTLAFLKAKQF
eukprot:TRINITY_DN3645_c0_g1_i6.p4 TRINITY_DN3645_c0_g1~~TRINITY_DN3645_c0_g1_i6.p4  ORF type:complete len:101 (-),score=5.86 TRINITY_DN3645_c0_g1_i6:735-1037(-)